MPTQSSLVKSAQSHASQAPSHSAINNARDSQKSLERHFGRKIRVDVTVDRAVLGGISVRIGDELIDGTVISRLVDASRALAGRQLAGKR